MKKIECEGVGDNDGFFEMTVNSRQEAHQIQQREMAKQIEAVGPEKRLAFGDAYQGDLDLVFSREDGSPIRGSGFVDQHHYPLLERAGVRKLNFHALRHTAASMMLARNVPIAEVSAMLGHASPAVTLSIYGHFMESGDNFAATAMEAVISA